MNNKMFLVYTILISVILASCTQGDRPNDVPFTATATKSISVSSATASQTLTPLDTPEVTSSPVLGPNSAPTLESEVAFRILHDYLKNTRPCLLPCWWGISAGASTLPDVQKQLSEFSGIATRVYFGPAGNSWIVGNLDINFDEGDSVIGVRTSYLISSGNSEIVSFVGIDTVSLPQNNNGRVYGDENYNELLFAYSLPQIVSIYGVPPQTFITAEIYEAEPTAPDYFVIRLLYPDLGMFLRYRMPTETADGVYRFCPSQSVVYLDLIPQEHGADYGEYFTQIGSTEWYPADTELPFYKSTEETIGLTNDEFYRLVTSSPEICFESPLEIWPEP